jgi:hypothetical protein
MPAPDVRSDFEAWAQVAARLRLRSADERADILSSLGLTQVWDEIHEAWALRLNQDIAAGRMELPHRYARICAKEIAGRPPSLAPPSLAPETRPMQLSMDARASSRAGFRDAIAPTAGPTPPIPGQRETLARDSSAEAVVVSAIKAKEAVEHWSVQQYARLCRELGRAANEDQRQAIWQGIGVMRVAEQQWVQQQWGERLAYDPRLFAAWTEAMARG